MRRRDLDQEDYYQRAHDQRVEPEHGLEPHMVDPDWGNVLIHPDQKKMPVGDPTLWGNTVTTLIDDDPVLGNTPRVIYGDQIIQAQANDQYSRSWSLSGVLAVKGLGWRFQAGAAPADAIDPPAEGLNVFLSVIQGVGKIQIEQQINLACNGFSTNIGLCWNQSSIAGGPYVPGYTPTPNDANSYIVLPFALIGALIGNTISVRGLFLRGGNAVGGAVPSAFLTCMITPYAPGQGI